MAKATARKKSEAVDPIQMLKDDHKKVKDLLKEFESAGEGASKKKQTIADKVFSELEVHATIEEEIFYPAVRENADEEGSKLVAEATEEHRLVKQLIEELRGLDQGDEQFEAKFKVLSENVEHHAEEEEKEMFPVAKKALKDQLEEIGEQMMARKEELLGEQAA